MHLRFNAFVTQGTQFPPKLNFSSLSQPKNTHFFNSIPNHGYGYKKTKKLYQYFIISGGFATNGYCSTINVTLKNDVLIHHDEYKFDEGLFQISAKINGKPSYVKDNSSIWYIPGGNNWGIGPLNRFFQ